MQEKCWRTRFMPNFYENGEGVSSPFLTYPGAPEVVDAFIDFYLEQGISPDPLDAEAQRLVAVDHVTIGINRIIIDSSDRDYLLGQGHEFGIKTAKDILETRNL